MNFDEGDLDDRRKYGDHKTLRLCDQVSKALALALAGECGDPILQSLNVESVAPAPDASRLLVTVGLTDPTAGLADILDRLERAKGLLRSEVARAITRKKAPDLAFRIAPPVENGA